MAEQITEISIALGDRSQELLIKQGKVDCPRVRLHYGDYPVISRAFAPMVRSLAFDISELALVTFLQALEAGKPLRLLPVVISGNMHHGSIFYDPAQGVVRPEDLPGKRVGMRAYTQTTGMWARGVLDEQFGVPLDQVTWVSWEGAHVAEYQPPANVQIIPGRKEIEMLRSGDVCAILASAKNVRGEGLKTVVADVDGAVQAWYAQHRTVPINHMVVVTESFLEKHPDAVQDVYDMLRQATDMTAGEREGKLSAVGYGADRIWDGGAIQLAMEYSIRQHLISRTFTKDQIFAGVTG